MNYECEVAILFLVSMTFLLKGFEQIFFYWLDNVRDYIFSILSGPLALVITVVK